MSDTSAFRIKIFADGADLGAMMQLYANPLIQGFTTNPTLMRKAGVRSYRAFALAVLQNITDRPISFEVLSDDFTEMERQAHEIASWGRNVNVKIPVTNTHGDFAGPLIRRLSGAGITVNVTAIMTLDQVDAVTQCLAAETPALISIFAGRIADTGRDPVRSCARRCRLPPRARRRS
jgi:transaldolase